MVSIAAKLSVKNQPRSRYGLVIVTLARSGAGAWLGWEVGTGWADVFDWNPQWLSITLAVLGATVLPYLLLREDRKPPGRSIGSFLPLGLQPYWGTASRAILGAGAGFLSVFAGAIATAVASLALDYVGPAWLDPLLGLIPGLVVAIALFAKAGFRSSAVWCIVAVISTTVWLFSL